MVVHWWMRGPHASFRTSAGWRRPRTASPSYSFPGRTPRLRRFASFCASMARASLRRCSRCLAYSSGMSSGVLVSQTNRLKQSA
eukprot:10183900-Alexandrium_andersonii.AAC.1